MGRGLVGQDFAHPVRLRPARSRLLAPLLAGTVIAALGLAALRVDSIRLRYGLAAAMRQEKALLEEQRELTARVQSLRDPVRLSRIAREQGWVRATRVIEVELPSVATEGAR